MKLAIICAILLMIFLYYLDAESGSSFQSLLLAPFSDEVTKKEGKLIKEALYQFISDTKVKI